MLDQPSFCKLFGERVKEARALKGLTQLELAKAINGAQPVVSRIESGRNASSISSIYTLWLVVSALDVSADFLLGTKVETPAPRHADVIYQAIKELSHEDQLLALQLIRRLGRS